MDPVSRIDTAGRAIAGLLGYNPGPGIYSRLERAVEAMPANVRVQELPGLLKRYKEGVPGWELRATDLDSTIAGRDVVPRDELLAAVRERSPVHTHGEVILGGRPQMQTVTAGPDWLTTTTRSPDYQHPDTGKVSRLGDGVSHGEPRYRDYGQGGKDYTELLIHQPGPRLPDYGSHWDGDTKNAVAHARFDTHGDALRINELQSDLGIHNRKAREYADNNPQIQFGQRLNPPEAAGLPFPLEDAWAEILIKRLALEAARKGHRAIEVASPRAIADKVGGNIDNYEHFYGKVVPGAIERLGRKMGGGFPESATGFDPDILRRVQGEITPGAAHAGILDSASADYGRLLEKMSVGGRLDFRGHMSGPLDALAAAADTGVFELREANRFRDRLAEMIYAEHKLDPRATELTMDAARGAADQLMPSMMARAADRRAIEGPRMANADAQARLWKLKKAGDPPYRYIMSDEMRRRLIEAGVGASVLLPLLMQGEE